MARSRAVTIGFAIIVFALISIELLHLQSEVVMPRHAPREINLIDTTGGRIIPRLKDSSRTRINKNNNINTNINTNVIGAEHQALLLQKHQLQLEARQRAEQLELGRLELEHQRAHPELHEQHDHDEPIASEFFRRQQSDVQLDNQHDSNAIFGVRNVVDIQYPITITNTDDGANTGGDADDGAHSIDGIEQGGDGSAVVPHAVTGDTSKAVRIDVQQSHTTTTTTPPATATATAINSVPVPPGLDVVTNDKVRDLRWFPHSTCLRQRLPVMADVTDVLTVHYAEPWIGVEGLGSGITLAMQGVLSLVVSAGNNQGMTHLTLPPLPDCSPFCSTRQGLGFDQLFDIEHMASIINRRRQEMGWAPLVIAATREIMQAAYPNASIDWLPWTSPDNGPMKLMLLSSLMPSSCLTPYLELMEKRMIAAGQHTNSTQRLCLHNRVEDDFRCWFLSAPGYYSTTEISTKLKHNLASRADFADIGHIYVAGAYDFDDIIDTVERITLRNTVTKRQLLIGERRGENTTGIEYHCYRNGVNDERAPKEYANTFLAVIDWFFCVQSDVFVGNNHSSWSGPVFVWKSGRVHNKLDARPVVALQYNDIGEQTQDVLHPFCEPNWSQQIGPWCHYYRVV
jgi:hypothetical protein